MAPQTLNLVIPQGTTLIKNFRFQHRLELAKDLIASVTSPPASIKIKPLAIDLPSGYSLIFPLSGCDEIELITSSITLAGSKSVAVVPYIGTQGLKCGAAANTLPKDLTGQVWSAAAKIDYRLEPVLRFAFSLTPLAGLVTMKALSTDTQPLASNCRYDQLPADHDRQKQSAYAPEIWAKAYYWDAEYQYLGDTFRALQGRLFVPAVATT